MVNDNIEQIEKATIDFANQIKTKINSEEKTETLLKTDQKVLARITDGIYRHAYSALRELICNSYDADATEIYIDTDVPLFRTITVRDNGNGMSIDTLSNVLHHIGGSAKRNPQKKDLGIFDQKDATLSPIKKRKLIGKIGIGLFSVAQLTRDFTIVTKQKGDDYYLIADIKLNNYSEEMIRQFEKRGEDFDTGIVYVYTQKTSNIEAHGTDIILKNLKQSAIDQLRSIDIWQQSISEDFELLGKPERPSYHIGEIDTDNNELLEDNAVLPWGTDLSPEEKYASLYSQLLKQPNPSYSLNLDNYLQMLWILGLSLPLKYIDISPYDLKLGDSKYIYHIQNNGKSPKKIEAENQNVKICELLGFSKNYDDDFVVFIDGVKLSRPIKYLDKADSSAQFSENAYFFGKFEPDFSNFESKETGGKLKFEAFIKWSPKILPKEHRGVFPPQNGEKILSSIIKLLTLQFERQNSTWLLFLTFRCDKQCLDTELLKKYMNVLYQNYEDVDFRKHLNSKIYQIGNEIILENDELLQENVFEEIVGISVLKWILKNSVEKGIHMKTRSVGMYKIGEKQKEEDEEGMLFSMVLEFKKDNSFVKDATSLLPTHNPVADEEVLCGIKIIDKISNASHIDDILEKNIELYNTLKQSILSLLDEAGYDIKCYPY